MWRGRMCLVSFHPPCLTTDDALLPSNHGILVLIFSSSRLTPSSRLPRRVFSDTLFDIQARRRALPSSGPPYRLFSFVMSRVLDTGVRRRPRATQWDAAERESRRLVPAQIDSEDGRGSAGLRLALYRKAASSNEASLLHLTGACRAVRSERRRAGAGAAAGSRRTSLQVVPGAGVDCIGRGPGAGVMSRAGRCKPGNGEGIARAA